MYHKIHNVALAIVLGVTWGIALFLVGIIGAFCEYGHAFIDIFSSVYIGFKATFLGSIIGLLYGLLDGFVGGLLIGSLYNFIVGKLHK